MVENLHKKVLHKKVVVIYSQGNTYADQQKDAFKEEFDKLKSGKTNYFSTTNPGILSGEIDAELKQATALVLILSVDDRQKVKESVRLARKVQVSSLKVIGSDSMYNGNTLDWLDEERLCEDKQKPNIVVITPWYNPTFKKEVKEFLHDLDENAPLYSWRPPYAHDAALVLMTAALSFREEKSELNSITLVNKLKLGGYELFGESHYKNIISATDITHPFFDNNGDRKKGNNSSREWTIISGVGKKCKFTSKDIPYTAN